MAQQYVYAVSGIKYGIPTGLSTVPAALVALPNTQKGTITFEEGEGTFAKFFEDQLKEPIRSVKTEEGELSFVAKFYDLNPIHLANLKGGTAVTGVTETYTPGVTYTEISKAIEVTFVSGHKLNIFNGSVVARMTGSGSRDGMLGWEIKVTPQVTADGTGVWNMTK